VRYGLYRYVLLFEDLYADDDQNYRQYSQKNEISCFEDVVDDDREVVPVFEDSDRFHPFKAFGEASKGVQEELREDKSKRYAHPSSYFLEENGCEHVDSGYDPEKWQAAYQ
jgi:hypothetical protein